MTSKKIFLAGFGMLLLCLLVEPLALNPLAWAENSPPVRRVETETDPLMFPFIWSLRFYSRWISPADGATCSMSPTCSGYARQALARHGPFIGFMMAAERVMRYHLELDYNPLIERADGRYAVYDPVSFNDFWFTSSHPYRQRGYGTYYDEVALAAPNFGAVSLAEPAISDQTPDPAPSFPVSRLTPEEVLAFADALMAEADYDRAITEYKRFLLFWPKDSRADRTRLKIGQCWQALAKWDQAAELFRLVSDQPNALTTERAEALYLLGDTFFRQAAYIKAIDRFQACLSRYPDQPQAAQAFRRIGQAYLRLARYQEARDTYATLSEKSWDFHQRLALINDIEKSQQLPKKSPTLAGLLSIVPGLGQLYCQRYQNAASAFLVNGLFIFGTYEALVHHLYGTGAILTIFSTGWYSGNIFAAVNSAEQYNVRTSQNFVHSIEQRYFWRESEVFKDAPE
jgi:tetratricopeptide (TPR) repeat protein